MTPTNEDITGMKLRCGDKSLCQLEGGTYYHAYPVDDAAITWPKLAEIHVQPLPPR
jgi:hypothetical protein